MGTTAEKLNKLLDTKAAIKDAIVAKGQSISDEDTFASYADKIDAIDTVASGTADATAAAGEILTGKTAYVAGSKVTGTMADQGAVSRSLDAGGSYTIPEGYHNGSGKVTAISLEDQTAGTAAASEILSGETAWVGGTKLTGTMSNNGAVSQTLDAGGSYTIPAGYHNGSGKVTANSLASQTDGDATASDILSGKIAWVDGAKVTGTIATKTSSNLSASGATVTVPAGYYASEATKSVSTATQATPSISVSSSGLITASATQTAGYVSAGTKSATNQLTTQAAKTITPSTSAQTAVASGVYTTGAVTVAAMSTATQATPSISVSSAGLITASATQTAGYVSAGTKSATKQMTVKAATTWTPTTSNQTIAASTYLTGAQTIKGDSNLVAANIKSGTSIFGVSGTYAGPDDALFMSSTTKTAALPSSANWYSVAYGKGKFVVVASSTKAAYSTDGITWTAATLPSSATWQSVAYGNGKFVAVAYNSATAAYSTDGITWTAATLPSSTGWHSVTYGNGKFVALTGTRTVTVAAYSTDGITWTAATTPPTYGYWYSVTYGAGKFVAVSNLTTTAAYSTDGITWTTATLPTAIGWYSVTYGNGKFVAVGTSSATAAYSTDGITWTAATLPSSANWYSVTYGAGKFVAVAYNSTKAAYSTDGITWTSTLATAKFSDIDGTDVTTDVLAALGYA